jgi:hypothetical protein
MGRFTGCQKFILASHIWNELPVLLPYLLEMFVYAQMNILQNSPNGL